MNMYGSAYSTSTMRIMKPSVRGPEIAGDRAPGDADAQGSPGCEHADQQRQAHAVEGAHEQVAAQAVGAEPVRGHRPGGLRRCCQSSVSKPQGLNSGPTSATAR